MGQDNFHEQIGVSVIYKYLSKLKQQTNPPSSDMKFPKENKKYFLHELHGNISNYFTFSIQDLSRSLKPLTKGADQFPPMCASCQHYLTANPCRMCLHLNDLPDYQTTIEDDDSELQKKEKKKGFLLGLGKDKDPAELAREEKRKEEEKKKSIPENFLFKTSNPEGGNKQKMQECVILCVDLSGSMNITYPSKYKKINEELVARILGQKNFEELKKKIGKETVIKNYINFKTLLDVGESVKSIVMNYQDQLHFDKSMNKNIVEAGMTNGKKEAEEYIKRKEIIEIAISKYLHILKERSPDTLVTIVYFHSSLEIPMQNFDDKAIIPEIEMKTLEEMMELGAFYADKISIASAGTIGENLLMNLTKAEPDGQTAMTPALAFCFGLASKMKHYLHQIVVVTDGESNIGFGRTEEGLPTGELEASKKLFQSLALDYAIPLNCVLNIITFQDCQISFDIIDQMLALTSGLPCQITFHEEGEEKIITDESITNIQCEMFDNFIDFPKQLCFNSKIMISCDKKCIKFRTSPNLKHFLSEDPKTGAIIIKSGIKPIGEEFKIEFYLPKEVEFAGGNVRFTIASVYEKREKTMTIMRTETIKVLQGTTEKGEKEEIEVMGQELKEKLREREFFEEDLNEYSLLAEKLEQNEKIQQGLDQDILSKFQKKKAMLEKKNQSISKLEREKMSMKSMKSRTFKSRQVDREADENGSDEDDQDFFK